MSIFNLSSPFVSGFIFGLSAEKLNPSITREYLKTFSFYLTCGSIAHCFSKYCISGKRDGMISSLLLGIAGYNLYSMYAKSKKILKDNDNNDDCDSKIIQEIIQTLKSESESESESESKSESESESESEQESELEKVD